MTHHDHRYRLNGRSVTRREFLKGAAAGAAVAGFPASIAIGSEIPVPELRGCSIVANSYRITSLSPWSGTV